MSAAIKRDFTLAKLQMMQKNDDINTTTFWVCFYDRRCKVLSVIQRVLGIAEGTAHFSFTTNTLSILYTCKSIGLTVVNLSLHTPQSLSSPRQNVKAIVCDI